MSSVSLHQLVDDCTLETLSGPDWGENLALCDIVNTNPMCTKEVVKILKARIKHKKPQVQILAIDLMEGLVKNCPSTHAIIGGREFQNSMQKLATNKKTNSEVRAKLLGTIHTFANSFRNLGSSNQYHFQSTYNSLKKTGADFPDGGPSFTPPSTRKHSPSKRSSTEETNLPYGIQRGNTPPSSTSNFETQVTRLSTLELCKATTENITLLREMISATRGAELAQNDIVNDILTTLNQNKQRVRELIEAGTTDEDIMVQLFGLNDSVESVLSLYESALAGKSPNAPADLLFDPEPVAATTTTTSSTTAVTQKNKAKMYSLDSNDFNSSDSESESKLERKSTAHVQQASVPTLTPPGTPGGTPGSVRRRGRGGSKSPQTANLLDLSDDFVPPPTSAPPLTSIFATMSVTEPNRNPNQLNVTQSPPATGRSLLNSSSNNEFDEFAVIARRNLQTSESSELFDKIAMDAFARSGSGPAPIPSPNPNANPFANSPTLYPTQGSPVVYPHQQQQQYSTSPQSPQFLM